MLLVIDNYDSFTYNLVQYFSELYAGEIRVFRNDRITVDEIAALAPGADRYFAGPVHPAGSGRFRGNHQAAGAAQPRCSASASVTSPSASPSAAT